MDIEYEKVLEMARSSHTSICNELNMDSDTMEKSWEHFRQTKQDNILEGDQTHWLCCAIYVACRNAITPTVGGQPGTMVKGNCVSLTRLLRNCKITLHEFFKKMKQWMEMVDSPNAFQDRINHLSNSLAVSVLVYEKYRAIFIDLFAPLLVDEPKKSNKKTKLPCTSNRVYEFCWYLFICAKGEFPENTVDLVTSFDMLLCCVDLVFANAIADKRKDLLNLKFPAIPNEWTTSNGDVNITSGNNISTIKPMCIMPLLCERHDGTAVDAMRMKTYNWRTILDKYVKNGILKCDKNTFLGLLLPENFEQNLLALKRKYEAYVLNVGEIDEGIFLAQLENSALNQSIQTQMEESRKQLMPETPLTRRNCLPSKQTFLTPVAMATQSVNRLRLHLSNYGDEPHVKLRELLSSCTIDPFPKIKTLLQNMCDKFCEKFETNGPDRFRLAEAVYYRLLENIIRNEMSVPKNFDIKIVNVEIFHATLIASSVEIVIYAYMAQKKFPWILECFSLDALNFYKIIEMIVLNHKDMLTRDVIKHLNAIEEQCLDSLAWRSLSPLWDQIEQYGDTLPERQHTEAPVATDVDRAHQQHQQQHSSPSEKVSKQLFKTSPTKSSSNGTIMKIEKNTINSNTENHVEKSVFEKSKNDETTVKVKQKPPRSGSLILFLRKFYKLAYLRVYELCKHLNYLDEGYLQKIWTIFEYCITKQFHLMRDRHLDQIIMCSIYVFGRNNKFDTTFRDIMTSYRKQPQAISDVYRDVHMTKNDKEYDKDLDRNNINDMNKKYDIIKFYNICYVRSMQEFVINTKEECLLSPLPPYTRNQMLSPRKVSEHHSVYIQPMEPKDFLLSPTSLTYSFKSSPIDVRDLSKINMKVNPNFNSNSKRNLPFDNAEDSPSKKRNRMAGYSVPYMTRKLQNLITDRQENTDKQNHSI